MTPKVLYAAVAALAVGGGTALWWLAQMPRESTAPAKPDIAPSALYAASFTDLQGGPASLGQFEGRWVVLNFWATWCAPCREEMPAFARLQERWRAKGVQFVGLANDDPGKVEQFGKEIGINYPLWVGGENVGELSRRLGNRLGVLPHTAILDRSGRLIESKVGPYSETDLTRRLAQLAANGG